MCNSTYLNCAAQKSPWRQRVDWWLSGAAGEMGTGSFMGAGFGFGVWGCFRTRQRRCLHSMANVLHATRLIASEWLFLLCEFTSVNYFK